jgi:hypothetical protein
MRNLEGIIIKKGKMLYIQIIGAVLFLAVLAIVINSCNKKKSTVIHRLSWFELQVAPFDYRFAIIPNQPILIGSVGEEKATLLLRYEQDPLTFDKIIEQIDSILSKNKIENMIQYNPAKCFDDASLEKASIHLRFMHSDKTKWSSYYSIENIPQEISTLINETKQIGEKLLSRSSNIALQPDKVDDLLNPENNPQKGLELNTIIKINITNEGIIEINRKPSSFEELLSALDELKKANGSIWYSRENPNSNPNEQLNSIIEKVLNEIVKRQLPIKLNEEQL